MDNGIATCIVQRPSWLAHSDTVVGFTDGALFELETDALSTTTLAHATVDNEKCKRAAPNLRLSQIAIPVAHSLDSEDSRLGRVFTHSLHQSGWREVWFHLIPSRLSHDRTIDLTVRLFVAAETFCRRPTPSHQEVCRQHYARALQSLRRSLACGKDLNANEEVLIAIAMLATASHMLKSPDTAAHLKGTNAVLAAQPDDGKQASELMRASMLRNTVMMFASPLCKGEASPCDMNRCWLEMEVPALYATTKVGKENARLRMLSQQLFMRLPRLIAAVRKLRAGDAAGLTQATDLARDLLTLQDKAAESSVLHAVSVRKSSPQDSAVLPYRYHFPDHHLYEAAVYYWQARLILNSLRVKIKVLHPNNRYTCADGIIEELEAENVNFAMNMLMTLPYAIDIGWYGRHPLFIGTMALWGVTCTGASHLRSTPMDQIRALILRRYRELMHRGAELTESLMDEAADTLAGGPIGALLYGYFG